MIDRLKYRLRRVIYGVEDERAVILTQDAYDWVLNLPGLADEYALAFMMLCFIWAMIKYSCIWMEKIAAVLIRYCMIKCSDHE